MSPHQIFPVANFVSLCCWLMLMLLPGRKWVTHMVTGVAALFANPWLLLAGWIHYLAFDLLVGTWEARDARERGVHHLALVPCLFLTFMFGPAGWLTYLGVRMLSARTAQAQLAAN